MKFLISIFLFLLCIAWLHYYGFMPNHIAGMIGLCTILILFYKYFPQKK